MSYYHLEQIERPRVTQEIADARDKGDLSENAEYHAAKEEQSHLEFKIAKLKNVISNARILDESQLDTSKVLIHSNVVIKNVPTEWSFLTDWLPILKPMFEMENYL